VKTHGLNSGNVLLTAIATALLVAQLLVPAHSLDHDTGFAQGQVCAACVAASQLSTGCVDNVRAHLPTFSLDHAPDESDRDWTSCDSPCVRQRGPPTIP
jgi:hypothetical protein